MRGRGIQEMQDPRGPTMEQSGEGRRAVTSAVPASYKEERVRLSFTQHLEPGKWTTYTKDLNPNQKPSCGV